MSKNLNLSVVLVSVFSVAPWCTLAAHAEPLPKTQPLTSTDNPAAAMVAGMHKYLDRTIAESAEKRKQFWKPDYSSLEAYMKSVEPNRQRLRTMLGVVDERLPPAMDIVANFDRQSLAFAKHFRVHRVRWPVLPGVFGEGLMLDPIGSVFANIVMLPEAGSTPEAFRSDPGGTSPSALMLSLAANGCRVVMPILIDRSDTWSGNARLKKLTNISHREFIYRMAFEMGRHPIGFEVQKSLAVVDWFCREENHAPVGILGYGEGGLIAEFAGALDQRIVSTMVLGYGGPRASDIPEEPIDRNVWGLTREFGPPELGRLFIPRHFNVAPGGGWQYQGPLTERKGAAPGRVAQTTDEHLSQQIRPLIAEYERAGVQRGLPRSLEWAARNDGTMLNVFLSTVNGAERPKFVAPGDIDSRPDPDAVSRTKGQFDSLVNHCQRLWRDGEFTRDQFFWKKGDRSSPAKWDSSCDSLRAYFHDEIIGKLPPSSVPPNPRSRKIYDEPKWTGHEVMLDLQPDVFAYGILLTPKDLKPGERRPVVVCQHGLEGTPRSCIDPEKRPVYNRFAAKLADLGYVVYCPQNPYIGGNTFRQLQRKANPLKLSLFSFILQQHAVTLDWLNTLPYVDPARIAFYGLSYGGKTAMRVPAIEKRYCLSICSADFNDWVGKCVSVDLPMSYMYMGEYELPEFNLGNTFNYAEMAGLIAPRPFMVERGHDDGVGIDEWVAAEYAKVRRLYAKLGIPERTTIEFFNGGHEIHGVGTFAFLKQHLGWPK